MSDRPIKNMEIEEAITLIRDEKHKKMLLDFKASFSEEDLFTVTAHNSNFEIIVSHPSENDFTGGAEQYFLDKKTGRFKMGWHEHPMPIPKPTKIDEDVH